jgi:hypothetical protein
MTEWYMEGPWFKCCNCDPGCPCDFNQFPTHGHCEGLVAMRIDKGHFGDVDLSGLCWAGVVRWPGALHEGNGTLQPILDSKATEEQVNALGQALSGQHGDTLLQIVDFICPTKLEPVFAPFEFEFDLEERTGRLRAGDALELDVETLRNIEPPTPYRVVVQIPNGFEYTGPDHSAETALATRIRSTIDIELDLKNSHASMAWVTRGSHVGTGATPTVVEDA